MFVEAIEAAAGFTRPIHSISRTYGGNQILPGCSTLFFVNEEGYAVTCKHVVEMLASADNINSRYNNFRQDRQKLPRDHKHKKSLLGLELKYGYKPETTIQLKNNFLNCVDQMSGFNWHLHPSYDLAILKFNDYNQLAYTGHAVFIRDDSRVKQGKFLCRLGFPFPEFTNFRYHEQADDIEWTQAGNIHTPRFPLEGMITRHLADAHGVYGIELSTPGLRGQSGGPLFDERGVVYGMQFSTKHMHLGFDIENKEVLIGGKQRHINDYSFLHLGQCIHASAIKAFLKEHGVRYYEED
ncbi:MAG: serine protease [Chitinophagaceae bacterium]|nr:serine protease [Chitinophagaceae bacterium]